MELTKTVYKTRDEIIGELEYKAYDKGFLTNDEFAFLIQELLVSEDGYVLDTGNGGQVNAEIALRIIKKIKKHPKLWEWLFMVA
jgi:hypothetical protein